MGTGQQQFCVRWNSYQSNLQNAFPKLLTSEHFVDVTLACESEMIKCHKVVLSACSTYFEKLLVQNPCQHPIIFMKDMRFMEMQALVDFMYKGEVNVTQDELPSLLKSAEALQIRGLCGSDQLLSQHHLGNLQTQAAPMKVLLLNRCHIPQMPLRTTDSHLGNEKNRSGLNQQINNSSSAANSLPSETAKPAASSSQPQPQPHLHQLPGQVAAAASAGVGGVSDASAKRKPSTASDGGMPLEDNKSTSAVSSSAASAAPSSENDETESLSHLQQHHHQHPASHLQIKEEHLQPLSEQFKEEMLEGDESYYEGDSEIMDSEYLEDDDGSVGHIMQDGSKGPDFAIANVSCQYETSPGANRRIRRSDAELRRAADCITRGQTFQTVSDQFNIPISTIRFYMARKGILPRRKRGRACSTSSPQGIPMSPASQYHQPGNTSPIGPPYHIVHYKLPALGAKLK